MIEDRRLVHEQPVMTAIQLVDLGQPGILAQQIGQSAALALRWSRLFGQLPGRNKLKAGSRLLV